MCFCIRAHVCVRNENGMFMFWAIGGVGSLLEGFVVFSRQCPFSSIFAFSLDGKNTLLLPGLDLTNCIIFSFFFLLDYKTDNLIKKTFNFDISSQPLNDVIK